MISEEHTHFEIIADGLAQQGLSVIDNFLSIDEIDKILQLDEFKNKMLHFKKAGIGNSTSLKINESVRGDYISWIDPVKADTSIKIYIAKVRKLISYLNSSLYLSLKDTELHLTSYPVGSYYKRHLDQFKKDDHRKISIILYLNVDWTANYGGQLRAYLKEGEKDVFPLAGRLVCMRSDLIEHEVLPATRERLSITGWMLDQLIEIR